MSAVSAVQSDAISASTGTIKVRRMDFEFSDQIPDFWFDNNPFLTSLMIALSVSFPPGERYFIDSVRHFQNQIDDPDLKAQIRAFIGQEANHTKEHIAMNKLMDDKGYPATAMENFVRKRVAWIQENSTPEENLARTAALEHLTAIMAGTFLEHPEVLDKMHPELARVWAWHAVEEVEHRAVAFDVYKTVVDDERLRTRAMVNATFFFILVNTVRTLILMNVSGNLFNLKAWGKGLNMLWGRPGALRKIIPSYFTYYRKGFHPSQLVHDAQVAAAKLKYFADKA